MKLAALSLPSWAVAIAASIAVLSLSANAADEESPSTTPAGFDFKGKIVVLVIDQSNALEQRQNTEVLEKANVQNIGGRHFITGSAYSPPELATNWRTGAEVGVAWDNVQTYYAYTPEQFQNYAKRWTESDEDD